MEKKNRKTARGGGVPQAVNVRKSNTLLFIITWLGIFCTLILAYKLEDIWDGVACILSGLMTIITSAYLTGGAHERTHTTKAGAVHNRTRSGHEKEFTENNMA